MTRNPFFPISCPQKSKFLSLPKTPSNPYPEDEAVNVPIDVVLSWTGGEENPPLTPVISGQINGKLGEEYNYRINSVVDPDGDRLWVLWDCLLAWGRAAVTGQYDSDWFQKRAQFWGYNDVFGGKKKVIGITCGQCVRKD